jgi:hypothetical protein
MLDQIKENSNVMVILEIQGIRCSVRSFQIDIELKQMMVLKPDDLFDTCILKSRKDTKTEDLGITSPPIVAAAEAEAEAPNQSSDTFITHEYSNREQTEPLHPSSTPPTIDLFEPKPVVSYTVPDPDSLQMDRMDTVTTEESIQTPENSVCSQPAGFAESSGAAESFELREVDFDLEEMSETDTISIKQRKDVYYEMYREALQKAKVAKDLALSSYLEAKQIKNKYMLDDISDEEEFEQESDEEFEDDENQGNQEFQEAH